jgi:hypothetical protein
LHDGVVLLAAAAQQRSDHGDAKGACLQWLFRSLHWISWVDDIEQCRNKDS